MADIRAIRELEPWSGADVIASLLLLGALLAGLAWMVARWGRS